MSVKFLLAASVAALYLGAGIGGAEAATASATSAVNIRLAPGGAKVDFLLPGEQVEVIKCSGGWCAITHPGPDGWVSQAFLSFDEEEAGFDLKDDSDDGEFGDGDFDDDGDFGDEDFGDDDTDDAEDVAEVCFYDKANFGGQSFCVEGERTVKKLNGYWNDRISSIEISGGLTVDLCSEKNLYGACGTISSTKAYLPAGLNNKATSYDIY